MSFNLDPLKQAQEVLFSNKATKTNHSNIIFNGNAVQNSANQKHLGLFLDEKITFNDHITSKLTTVNKLTSTLRKLYHYIPRDSLVTTYKSFIRPHLDYTNVMFDKLSNATFSNRIESAQNNAALAITGTIRGTSKGKLYQELGFETMKERKWFRRLFKQIFSRPETFSNSFYLRQLDNGTNLIPQSIKLVHIQYFPKHF